MMEDDGGGDGGITMNESGENVQVQGYNNE